MADRLRRWLHERRIRRLFRKRVVLTWENPWRDPRNKQREFIEWQRRMWQS